MNRQTSNVIPMADHAPPAVRQGVVTAVGENGLSIAVSGKTVRARKAFSCIIEPEVQDTVLCCRDDTGTFFVLAIMDRPRNQAMKLVFPSDATLESASGSVNVFSKKAINMAAKDISAFSKNAVHKSDQGYIAFDRITASGTEVHASYKTVRLISGLINTMARQVIDKFKGYIRHTEDNDQVQAGQLTRRTSGLYSMDSRNTVMISKKETKIDGEKIYMA